MNKMEQRVRRCCRLTAGDATWCPALRLSTALFCTLPALRTRPQASLDALRRDIAAVDARAAAAEAALARADALTREVRAVIPCFCAKERRVGKYQREGMRVRADAFRRRAHVLLSDVRVCLTCDAC